MPYNYDTASIQLPLDSHSTVISPRYNHPTTYVTTNDCVWAAALWPM